MQTDGFVLIPLTQGKFAIVSPEDEDLLMFKWFAERHRKQFYCGRNSPTVNGKRHAIRLHKVILERILGRSLIDGEQVDHIDLNPLNNQRSNLRLATVAENIRNRGLQSRSKSGYKGVWWFSRKKKWGSSITINRKRIFLGYFDNPIDAHEAYCNASRKYHGEFGRTE